ncbi:hypothetical protein VTI28DRAFT_8085 [Corynascus sepedonium]
MSLTDEALKHVNSIGDDIPGLRRRRTQEWFNDVPPTPHDGTRPDGIISQLHHCISCFCIEVLNRLERHDALDTEPMSKSLYRMLDNVYDNFLQWSDQFEVGNGKLDDLLKDSEDLRQFIIKIMVRICETLTNELLPSIIQVLQAVSCKSGQSDSIKALQRTAKEFESTRDKASQHVQSNADSDNSEISSDGAVSDASSLEEILECLKSDVEILIDLEPCLEDPIRDTILKEKPAPPPEIPEFTRYQPFFDGIKQKYPQCDDGLARSISRSLYDTTMRLHAERQQAASVISTNPPVYRGKLPKDSGCGTSIQDPSHGSDDDTQRDNMPAGCTYARTLASYAEADEGDTKTPFPSQPKELITGQKFPCIACGRQVAKSERASAWRRHLLSDLRPWVCCQLSCDCSRTPYRTRDEWLVHLQAQHEIHPRWNDKTCPFCQQSVETGGREMARHVERHLWHLFLAALTANPGSDGENDDSDHDSDTLPRQAEKSRTMSHGPSAQRQAGEIDTLKDHPLYTQAVQGQDGLWHCPWEGEGYCDHKPSVLRADFDKFVRQHMESLRCKIEGCASSGKVFATQEILHLHEQKEHGMHKNGGQFLCTSPGCGRSRPGNGFANRWVQIEHIKNVHENIPNLPAPTNDNLTAHTPAPRAGTFSSSPKKRAAP